MNKKHISYSAIKEWMTCPHRFRLLYVDRVEKFAGNEHTTLGTACHTVLENRIMGKSPATTWEAYLDNEFLKEIKKSYAQGAKKFNKKLVEDMRKQGKEIIHEGIPALKEHFGDFEILGTEIQLYEPIDDEDFKFKGFIDLVIKVGDKIHVIDWKTTSWGWDARKKSDKAIVYQLILYKHFFSQKLEIPMEDVEVHFALLKRTAKQGKKVEIVSTTSGPKRTQNALDTMKGALSCWKNGVFIKNKLACDKCYCQFKKTKWCP